ncbi:LysR family transcriptional regulator [Paracoccus suum]|uniref:LysR family transcriptional regulator n=1 Tax=Paracoccus suum TaxID=2259340 RepID=A0A344PGE9_9RHOB|nr:LysR substrate-binding domain-containing protein [Paracoccus suum]AXC48454.1 LysR family transcriptional regulator [Paracoccus suum]
MTIEQLRIFLEVARLSHVTRAAEVLGLTQSAVSAAIMALEARHGVALFHRVGRRIEITPAGTVLIDHARQILRQMAEAEAALNDSSGRIAGPLRVQASQTVASYFLPPVLVAYRSRYPDVLLGFADGNTASVAQAVADGEADLGVVEGLVLRPEIEVTPLISDRLAVLVGPRHPWADGRRLRKPDLQAASWVLREAGSGTRAAFDAALAAEGIDSAQLAVTLELPSNEACIAAVETGHAATAISERAAAAYLAQGLIIAAGHDFAPRWFTLLRHKDRAPGPTARAFMEMVRAYADGEGLD